MPFRNLQLLWSQKQGGSRWVTIITPALWVFFGKNWGWTLLVLCFQDIQQILRGYRPLDSIASKHLGLMLHQIQSCITILTAGNRPGVET